MIEHKNIPEIRFKGFERDWVEMSFDQTFDNIPNNSLSRDKLNYRYGLARNIHYGDVLIKFGETLDFNNSIVPFITDSDVVENLKATKLQDGDIVIADAAEDESVGKCTELINSNGELVFSGLHTIPVRPKEKFALGYLGYYLNSSAYHDQLIRLMQGTKVLSISKSTIRGTTIVYPQNPAEQTRIGTFFQSLDKLLILHQKQYTKLSNLKKAMLEKMFPRPGADTPEIRFKGFEGKWKQDELSSLAYVFDGTHQTPHYTEKGIMFLSVENIKTLKSQKFISHEAFEKEFANYPEKGDVLMTRIGDIGTTNVVESEEKVAYYVSLALLKHKKLNPYFLKECLMSEVVKEDIWRKTLHIAFPKKINKSEIEKINIPYPDSETEQAKIGTYFQNLDRMISHHQTRISKLQNIKKACLEKMFV